MPLPAHDWSSPATHYGPEALDPEHHDYQYDEHNRDASLHAHNLPADPADLGPAIRHIAAHPATRGGPGWVGHRHA